MRRRIQLVGMVGVVALSVAGVERGRAQEAKVVEIDTLNVRDTLYHLSGGGANALALIDEINGGVVLIDAKLPGWGEAVREALAGVTDLPVTTIINTHGHPDHAGANSEFGPEVEIIAHENTKANMMTAGVAENALPTTTFTDQYSLLEGLDRIDLYYFGAGHTDGNIVVVFPEKGVAYLGDLLPLKAAPGINVAHGGSGVAFADTLGKAVAEIEGVTRVITGHGPFPSTYAGRGRRETGARRPWTGWVTWDDVAEYADFNRDFVAAVKEAFEASKSADDAAATLQLPERYAAYGMDAARDNVEAIYGELAAR